MDTINLSQRGMLFPIGAGDTVAAGTLAAWQYLHHVDFQYDGVISSGMGKRLLERRAHACGSASCLKEGNWLFDIEDAMEFLHGMKEPVFME
ncbi:hypothetical protein ACHAW6_003019 [Cyclotella cf. meneghiniana]